MSTKYPSINCVNPESQREWKGPNAFWYIQEKIDGSQMSFGFVGDTLSFFNKGKIIKSGNKIFNKAMMMISEIQNKLDSTLIYHCEVVQKKKHSTVLYNRTPEYYIILYDLQEKSEGGRFFSYKKLIKEAERVGLECTQVLYDNKIEKSDESPISIGSKLISEIENGNIQSCLGGTPEGIVIKHNNFYDENLKRTLPLKYKMVTSKFREEIGLKQKKQISDNFLENLGLNYNVVARFRKAVYRLRDSETLSENKTENLDKLIAELDCDFDKEYENIIKSYLWCEYRDGIIKSSRTDFVSWYKTQQCVSQSPKLTKDEIIDFVTSIGFEYNKESRFKSVVNFIETNVGPLDENKNKNIAKICQYLDNDIDNNSLHFKNLLWEKFSPTIKTFARRDFITWYSKF